MVYCVRVVRCSAPNNNFKFLAVKLVEILDKVDQIFIEGLFDFKMMLMIVRKWNLFNNLNISETNYKKQEHSAVIH